MSFNVQQKTKLAENMYIKHYLSKKLIFKKLVNFILKTR